MATAQRERTTGPSGPPPGPNPMRGGLILIVVGIVLAIILLVKAGGVGFDASGKDVKIGAGEEKITTTTEATTTTVAGKAPQTVQVVAANGSGKSGVAAKVAQTLAQSGYTQVVATNSNQPVTTSSVMYAAGYDANARAVAKALGIPESSVQALAAGATLAKDQPATAGVIVLIGPDVATTLAATPTTKPGTEPTTTVAGSTVATTGHATGSPTTTVSRSKTTRTTVAPTTTRPRA